MSKTSIRFLFFWHWLRRFCYFLLHNKWLAYIQVFFEMEVMKARLKRKGYSRDQALSILYKYVKVKRVQEQNNSREAMVKISEIIVKASAETGVPQWQIRQFIERKFGVEI